MILQTKKLRHKWHVITCSCSGKTHWYLHLNRKDVMDCDVIKSRYVKQGRGDPPHATLLYQMEHSRALITLGSIHPIFCPHTRYIVMAPSEKQLRSNYEKRKNHHGKIWRTYLAGLSRLVPYAKKHQLPLFHDWESVFKYIDQYESDHAVEK